MTRFHNPTQARAAVNPRVLYRRRRIFTRMMHKSLAKGLACPMNPGLLARLPQLSADFDDFSH